MSYHSQFVTLTLGRYRAMVKRFSGKEDKRGRKYGLRMQVPFTLGQFREWMITQLSGSEEGTCRCVYCGTWLNIGTVEIDHRVPPARGGSLGFENLAVCCHACNQRKGGMLADSWMYLVKCADQLPEGCRRDLFQRLEIAVQLAAKRRWDIAKMAREKQAAPAPVAEA